MKSIESPQGKEVSTKYYFSKLFYGFLRNFRSINTQQAYKKDLKDFFLYLQRKGVGLPEVDHHEMVRYMNHLREFKESRKPHRFEESTINRKLSCLSKFFKYLININEVKFDKNPCHFLERHRQPLAIKTKIMPQETFYKLLEKDYGCDEKGLLYTSIMRLLLTTAMRQGELRSLKRKDLKVIGSEFFLEYTSKGKKFRKIKIHPKAIGPLKAYLEKTNNITDPESPLFFRTKKGRGKSQTSPISSAGIVKIFKSCLRLAGIDPIYTPHSARATAVTVLYSNGADIKDLKDFLGHESINMSDAYVKSSSDRIEKVASLF